MAAVRVLHEIKVSPSPSLPSQPPQPLSFLDSIWLRNSQLVERLFFFDFPHPTSHFIEHNLPILTKSLSLTLHHFHPLAGSIRRSPDSDDQFEIAYEEGDSVTITVAEFAGDDFRNISGYQPRNFKNLRLMVPKPAKPSSGSEFPLISIQITLFPNQGLCIGFAISHAACDGSGSMQLIRSWADACRSTEPTLNIISPPFLDRSIIIDTCDMRRKIFKMARKFKEIYEENLKNQDNALPVFDSSLVSATFSLSKYQIDRLKERVQAKGAKEGNPSLHISTFAVTSALVWSCLVKARGYDKDTNQCFGCVVDWRERMRPPIPSNYFGNCLGNFLTELKAGEIAGKDGIEVAAMEIGKSIDGLQGRDVVEVLESAFNTYLGLVGIRILTVAGSPKLRVYEVDFGWGRPVKVDITSIVETGAMSLAESRKKKGGMEIGLVLSKEEMNKFGMNYTAALLDL